MTTGFMLSLYDNHQAEKASFFQASPAWWFSYKDGMKPVVTDKHHGSMAISLFFFFFFFFFFYSFESLLQQH